jgi:exopolysaccharide production protein ExoZ
MNSIRTESASPTTKIISLQWLRFLAASMVLVYHASVYLNLVHKDTYGLDRFPTWFGSVGVALFFALSGNLMASAMLKSSAPKFLLHRVGRIYPAFFLVTALVVVASFFTPARALLDLQALTLFPYGKTSYPLGVEWTLVFEIAFYMFVFLLILFKKTGQASAFLVGWLSLILVHNVISPDNPAVNVFHPFTLPWVSLNVSFALGMLFPLVLKGIKPHPILALVIAYSVFMIGASHSVVGVRWGMGIGSALIVYSLSQFSGITPLRSSRWLNFMGDKLGAYSYALYLCHVPVIRTLYQLLSGHAPSVQFYAVIAAALLISIPLGEADLRMYRAIKRRIDRSEGMTPWVMAGAYTTAFFSFALFAAFQGR